MQPTFKAGQRVKMEIRHPMAAQKFEYGTIMRRTKEMSTLDELPGYYPVRFDGSKAGLMVHENRLSLAC